MRISIAFTFFVVALVTCETTAEAGSNQKEGHYVLGPGAIHCREAGLLGFFDGATNHAQTAKAWLNGYISGANQFFGKDKIGDLTRETSERELIDFTKVYCEKCPSNNFGQAAFSLVVALHFKQATLPAQHNIQFFLLSLGEGVCAASPNSTR